MNILQLRNILNDKIEQGYGKTELSEKINIIITEDLKGKEKADLVVENKTDWKLTRNELPKKANDTLRVSDDIQIITEKGEVIDHAFTDTKSGKFFTCKGDVIIEEVIGWRYH